MGPPTKAGRPPSAAKPSASKSDAKSIAPFTESGSVATPGFPAGLATATPLTPEALAAIQPIPSGRRSNAAKKSAVASVGVPSGLATVTPLTPEAVAAIQRNAAAAKKASSTSSVRTGEDLVSLHSGSSWVQAFPNGAQAQPSGQTPAIIPFAMQPNASPAGAQHVPHASSRRSHTHQPHQVHQSSHHGHGHQHQSPITYHQQGQHQQPHNHLYHHHQQQPAPVVYHQHQSQKAHSGHHRQSQSQAPTQSGVPLQFYTPSSGNQPQFEVPYGIPIDSGFHYGMVSPERVHSEPLFELPSSHWPPEHQSYHQDEFYAPHEYMDETQDYHKKRRRAGKLALGAAAIALIL